MSTAPKPCIRPSRATTPPFAAVTRTCPPSLRASLTSPTNTSSSAITSPTCASPTILSSSLRRTSPTAGTR
ncbi:hypothetical protein BC830DRAFT_1136995 [Chytriomyces sp. MP71]|nr:hypothetical protein BC830DRAFT_1136995 [Chytriomyces sp. MP71]